MELKIFRDALPAAGTNCTLKAELPLETEILISDYLPPVFKLVKCFVRPVVLQKRLQPGKLQLEGYLRCVVYYQGEEGTGLCQTEQKLPFTKLLDLPEFVFTAWAVQVEGQTEYLNCRTVNPRRIEVRGRMGWWYRCIRRSKPMSSRLCRMAGWSRNWSPFPGCGVPLCWKSWSRSRARSAFPRRPPPFWTSAAMPLSETSSS